MLDYLRPLPGESLDDYYARIARWIDRPMANLKDRSGDETKEQLEEREGTYR